LLIILLEKKKEKQFFFLAAVLYSTVQLLFQTGFLVELGLGLLFPEGKQHSKID